MLLKHFFTNTDSNFETIILKFRLPKAITALIVGIALSLSGLQMQTVFRNPMAGPDVLGISSGASLGVAFVILGFSVKHITRQFKRIGKLDSCCCLMGRCRSSNDTDYVHLFKGKRYYDNSYTRNNAFKRDICNCNNNAVFQ